MGKGFISPGFQIIDPQPADCPEIQRLVQERAQQWLGISTDSIREIIRAAGADSLACRLPQVMNCRKHSSP